MRKFLTVLAVSAGLLAACTDSSPPPAGVAASPTEAPTAAPTPGPTSVPAATREPTAVPTAVPTEKPAPTEVPAYVGLPAVEVEALRQDCRQEEPDSACLPLPFAPDSGAAITVISESWDGSGVAAADGEGGSRFLSLEVPAGTPLLSPLAGELWVRGPVPGSGIRWLGLPGRTVEGLSSVLFGWEPFGAYSSDIYRGREPSVELALVKGSGCAAGGQYQEGDSLKESDLAIRGGSRSVSTGELVAQSSTSLCLQISVVEPVLISIPIPPEGGGGVLSGLYPLGRTDLSDLLRDANGSIVYVLP